MTTNIPSSSKSNPKRRRKDINFWWLFLVLLGFWPKRHQLLMTFSCVFRYLTKNTRKRHQKLMSSQCLLDWISKMRGLTIINLHTLLFLSHTFLETFFKQRQLGDQISDGISQGVLRCVIWCSLNSQNNLVLKWMRIFIAGK